MGGGRRIHCKKKDDNSKKGLQYRDWLKHFVKAINAERWKLVKKRPITIHKITNKSLNYA
jgi:hypothetical protein